MEVVRRQIAQIVESLCLTLSLVLNMEPIYAVLHGQGGKRSKIQIWIQTWIGHIKAK